jgi:carnitine-CoA ligase
VVSDTTGTVLGPLPRVVRLRAERTPDRVLYGTASGQRLNCAEVHAAGQAWAAFFERIGVTTGETVCVMLPTAPVTVEVWLGLGTVGAVEVPINTAYRTKMLDHILEDSLAQVLVVEARYLDAVREVVDRLTRLRTLVVVGADDVTGLPFEVLTGPGPADMAPLAPYDAREHDLACVLYTSGTTGASKGVMVTWAQLLATATGGFVFEELGADDVFYVPFPLFHISGKNMVYLAAVLGGSTIFRETFKTDEFWSDVARYGCTTTVLLGAMANFLQRQPERPGERDTPLTHVSMVPVIADVDGFIERFGVNVSTVFNMTETSCPLVSDGYHLANTRSCGRQRPGYHVRLVDTFDNEVPVGEAGELTVRSDQPWAQMAGYWQRPEATVAAWRNQWLHTRDIFTRDENGNFYFIDRRKDATRRRGENMSSSRSRRTSTTTPRCSSPPLSRCHRSGARTR